MRVELLEGKTADEVEHIWMAHHASSDSHIATVLSKEEHIVLCARAAASPLFVLPLATQHGGFHTLLLQMQPPGQAVFTTLEAYKQQGPGAPPHLVLRMFDETADSHGLVLVRGDLVTPQLINKAQGRTLLELVRALYTDSAAYKMVWAFNHQPSKFDFASLCRELGVTAVGIPRGDNE